MSTTKKNIISNLLLALAVTIVSFILSVSSIHKLFNILDFTNSVGGSDFNMSDVYNKVADNRAVRLLNDQITVISIDGCDRQDIAHLISIINSHNPKAIGIDVLFNFEYEGDEVLIDAISNCSNLVLPLAIDEQENIAIESYFYKDFDNLHIGAINLDSYSKGQCVRTFRPSLYFDNETINSFGAEIASVVSPEAYSNLKERGNECEVIFYPSVDFNILNAADLFTDTNLYKEAIENKIILLGDLHNTGDYHRTPISQGIPGVIIHANIINTILSGSYIKSMSNWLSWFIAFVLCLIFIIVKVFSDKLKGLDPLVMRLFQLTCLYVFFVMGCKIFINKLFYVDFSPTMLMITIGLFAFDIWVGFVALFDMIFKKGK